MTDDPIRARDVDGLPARDAESTKETIPVSNDDLARRRVLLEGTADLDTVEPGQQEIEQHQVGTVATHRLEAGLAVRGRRHLEALAGQVVLDEFEDIGLVFDDHDSALGHGRTSLDCGRLPRGRRS